MSSVRQSPTLSQLHALANQWAGVPCYVVKLYYIGEGRYFTIVIHEQENAFIRLEKTIEKSVIRLKSRLGR